MKVLFVFNHPAPYKVHTFNELSKLMDIQVIFERKKAKDRPASFYSDNKYNFPHTFLKYGSFAKENNFSGSLKRYIKKHHQEYDLIVMNGYSQIAEMKAIHYMVRHNIPYVLQINGGVIKKESSLKKKIKTFYISHAYKYLSPCKDPDDYLVYYGADRNNIFHYPYGNYFNNDVLASTLSPKEKATIREKYNLPKGTLFVNASQFIERKNNLQLIEIFKNRPEHLLLIGSGKEKEKYEEIIRNENITNVLMMDFKEKQELFEILRGCDCFITLSKQDIFGHTTLEAMINGLPVISSDFVISSRDIIENGKNGYLVNIKDNDNIVSAINNIKLLDPQLAIEAARKNTIENSALTIYKVLESIK